MPQPRPQADSLRLPLRVAEEAPRSRGGRLAPVVPWALAAALAGGAAMLPIAWWGRIAIVIGLAAAKLVRGRMARAAVRAPEGWIVADARGVARVDAAGAARLAEWGARFGVTVLANERRDRGLFAFTTLEQTRYVRVRASADEAAAARELFAHAPIASDADVMLGARGADDVALGAADALRLVRMLHARAPGAFERILLSDSRGAPIALDGHELRVGERVIDLRSTVEWRGFMFFETAGHMSTVVQATWVRQAGVELVLVAPMPAEVSGVRRTLGGDVEMELAAARDLRLMQAAPEKPPPHELRIAIERLFMVPLRQALDRAPRSSRPNFGDTDAGLKARKRSEGHAS